MIRFKQNMFGSQWGSLAPEFLCGQMLLHLQTSCFARTETNSRARVKICSVAQSVGSKVLGLYRQEKIIERRSTNEARMAALINVTLFARRSILNVIYLNESVCSRKLGIHPRGALWLCWCVPSPSTPFASTSANTHPLLKQGGAIQQRLRLFARTD